LMAPRARSKFGAPIFEFEVVRKQMYCVEERKGNCAPLDPLVTPLILASFQLSIF